MALSLRIAARSDVGLRREGNEDSLYAGHRLLAVADGMGGHAAGEVASAVAIGALAPLDEDAPGADLLDDLREAVIAANDQLRDMVEADSSLDGMGTTVTAVLITGSRLALAHVGDSRAYLLRRREFSQITHDHTLVQTLVDEGRLDPDDASSHPQRSMLTRALDGRGDIELDLSVREARPGDRYLLCTDGLSGVVSSATMQETLALEDPQEVVQRLVDLALRGGGPDNISVIVADVLDGAGTSGDVVIGGAATLSLPEGLASRSDSAAARAAAAARPLRVDTQPLLLAPPDPPPRPRGRRGTRGVLVGVLVVGVLAVAGAAGWGYLRSQYFVAVDGDRVAVFQGVNGSVGPVSLSSLERPVGLLVTDLPPVAQRRVRDGIPARSRTDAVTIVNRLAGEAHATCEAARPAPAPTTTPTPVPSLQPVAPSPGPTGSTPAPSPTGSGRGGLFRGVPIATPVPTGILPPIPAVSLVPSPAPSPVDSCPPAKVIP